MTVLCVECEHCRREMWCVCPSQMSIVTGKPLVRFAQIERAELSGYQSHFGININRCGPEGKFFKQKETTKKSWWRFWSKI